MQSPETLAQDVPDHLAGEPLGAIGLPGEVESKVLGLGAETVGDLRLLTQDEYLACPGAYRMDIDLIRDRLQGLHAMPRGQEATGGRVPLLPAPVSEAVRHLPISLLGLTPRSAEILGEFGAETVGHLDALWEAEFLAARGGGKGGLARLRARVAEAEASPPELPAAPGEGPRILAADYPDAVLDTPLERIVHRPATLDALRSIGAVTVRDLKEKSAAEFDACPNVRARARHILLATVEAHAEAVERSRGEAGTCTLAERVRRSVAALPERQADILALRIGLTGAPVTLQEIGDAQGVTRERIRQIQAKAVKAVELASDWPEAFRTHLADLAERAPVPVPDAAAEAWAVGLGEHMVKGLTWTFGEPVLFVSEAAEDDDTVPGLLIPVPAGVWRRALAEGRKAIEAHFGIEDIPVLADAVRDALCRMPDMNRQGVEAVLRHLRLHPGTDATVAEIHGAEAGRRSALRAILAAAPGPMSFADIHAALADATGAGMSISGLRCALEAESYWAGEDSFGSLADVDLYGDPRPILDVARATMSAAAHRRWSATEIHDRADWGRMAVPGPCVLAHILRRSGEFTYHGHGVLSLPEAGGGYVAMSLNEACVAIVERMGRPVRAAEIEAILREERGLRPGPLLIGQGPGAERLIRVDRGVWGLVDRDMPIPPERVAAIQEAAAKLAIPPGTRIEDVHAAMVEDGLDLSGVSPTLLGAIVAGGGVYERGRFGTMRPAGTGRMGEDTFVARILAVMREAGEPLTENQIGVEVGKRFGRFPSHSTLRIVLNAHATRRPGTHPALYTLRPEA